MINFTCKFPFRVFVPSMGFIFAYFRYKRRFRQIWVKTTENFHVGGRFTNYGVPYCSFWIWKSTFGIFWWNSLYIRFLFCLIYLTKNNSSKPCNWTFIIFLLRSVMVFLNTYFYISWPIRKKAWNSRKPQRRTCGDLWANIQIIFSMKKLGIFNET